MNQYIKIRSAYLVKFVDPDKMYPVDYTIKQDGSKDYRPAEVLGKELTEPQIVKLFKKELL